MIGQPAEFVDQEVFIDTTLDLIMIYFQFATPFFLSRSFWSITRYRELCRSSQRGNKDMIKVLNSPKRWATLATSLSMRGIARVIDILVAEFSLPR
jgi:hypothetical protein